MENTMEKLSGWRNLKKDIHNPDASKHSDPLMGLLLLKDFAYDATKNNGQVAPSTIRAMVKLTIVLSGLPKVSTMY